jgi:hypothetical protein
VTPDLPVREPGRGIDATAALTGTLSVFRNELQQTKLRNAIEKFKYSLAFQWLICTSSFD